MRRKCKPCQDGQSFVHRWLLERQDWLGGSTSGCHVSAVVLDVSKICARHPSPAQTHRVTAQLRFVSISVNPCQSSQSLPLRGFCCDSCAVSCSYNSSVLQPDRTKYIVSQYAAYDKYSLAISLGRVMLQVRKATKQKTQRDEAR